MVSVGTGRGYFVTRASWFTAWFSVFVEAERVAGPLDSASYAVAARLSADILEHAKYPDQLIREREDDKDLLESFVGNEDGDHRKSGEQSLAHNVLHAKR